LGLIAGENQINPPVPKGLRVKETKMKQKHLKHIKKLTKQALDLLRQELFAVSAVAIICLVVVLTYTYHGGISQLVNKNHPPTTGGKPPISSLLPYWSGTGFATTLPTAALIEDQLNANTYLGDALLDNEATIYFGSTIKGYNNDMETWKSETGIQNHGSYLQFLKDNQVTITGVTNGNHTLWVKGKGTIKMNGVTFLFRTLGTMQKVVSVSGGKLTIDFKLGAQIYTISTLSDNLDIPVGDATTTAAKILMFPNKSTVILTSKGTATFKPVVILTDQYGKQITNTAGRLSWSSSNTAVANISPNGIVTATKIGTVTITANVTNTNLSASIYLTVKPPELSSLVDITPKTNL